MDIRGTYNEEKGARWNPKAFLMMNNLKFLRINDIDHVPVHLPDELRILNWRKFPAKFLPSTFQLDELIQLFLQQSNIEQLWIERKVIVLLCILTTLHLNFNKWTLGM